MNRVDVVKIIALKLDIVNIGVDLESNDDTIIEYKTNEEYEIKQNEVGGFILIDNLINLVVREMLQNSRLNSIGCVFITVSVNPYQINKSFVYSDVNRNQNYVINTNSNCCSFYHIQDYIDSPFKFEKPDYFVYDHEESSTPIKSIIRIPCYLFWEVSVLVGVFAQVVLYIQSDIGDASGIVVRQEVHSYHD